MGEAKRRTEQHRRTPPLCVFCGVRPATTRDHAVPKGFFAPPRPQLITVPACEQCNGSMSELEERFRVYIGARSGPDTPALAHFWTNGCMRTVKKNHRLLRELLSGTPLWVRSPTNGRFEQARTYKWPAGSHDPVIAKITRGLYYHHFGCPLSPATAVEVAFLDKLDDDIRDIAMGDGLVRRNLGGDNRFCYAYGRAADYPEGSLWIYQFYMRHWAAAVTKPQGSDLITLPDELVAIDDLPADRD